MAGGIWVTIRPETSDAIISIDVLNFNGKSDLQSINQRVRCIILIFINYKVKMFGRCRDK